MKPWPSWPSRRPRPRRQLSAEADRVKRVAAAAALAKQVSAIEGALGPRLETTRVFHEALSELAHFHYGCTEMSEFLANVRSQMEIAANFQLAELRTMPEAVREGQQPIPLPKPVVVPITVEQKPPVRVLFAKKSVKWTDSDGRKRVVTQWQDAELPLALADKALRVRRVRAGRE
jgi:hypothetical protein